MLLKNSIKSVKIAVVLATYLVSTLLIGCTTSPTLIEWEQEPITETITQPLEPCIWPELFEGSLDTGFNVLYMAPNDLKRQVACQVTEQGNHDIAADNADSVEAMMTAFNALNKKAELHNEFAQNELNRVEDERHRTALELLGYKVILIVGIVASIL